LYVFVRFITTLRRRRRRRRRQRLVVVVVGVSVLETKAWRTVASNFDQARENAFRVFHYCASSTRRRRRQRVERR
jgi:Cft2 family RNA processing exonuclease